MADCSNSRRVPTIGPCSTAAPTCLIYPFILGPLPTWSSTNLSAPIASCPLHPSHGATSLTKQPTASDDQAFDRNRHRRSASSCWSDHHSRQTVNHQFLSFLFSLITVHVSFWIQSILVFYFGQSRHHRSGSACCNVGSLAQDTSHFLSSASVPPSVPPSVPTPEGNPCL